MKVWIVEPVDFDSDGIEGVFDSLEAVKAAYPGKWESKNNSWYAASERMIACEYKVRTLDALGR